MKRTEYDEIDAVNFSTLKWILKTPAHYQDALAQQREKRELDPESEEGKDDRTRYIVGTLLHAFTLEGKDLRDLFAIKPKGMSFAKTEGKIWKSQQTLPIITQDEADGIPTMAKAIAEDPDARALLDLCPVREHAIVLEIEGVKCKALLDGYGSDIDKTPLIPDVKTCRDASPRAFEKMVMDRDYDFQAAWYSMLTQARYGLAQPPEFAWIAVENKRPFIVQCYYPTPEVWRSGREKTAKALHLLKTCQQAGKWPGYGGGLAGVELPAWRKKELGL